MASRLSAIQRAEFDRQVSHLLRLAMDQAPAMEPPGGDSVFGLAARCGVNTALKMLIYWV